MDPATAYQKLTGAYDDTVDENTFYQKLVDMIFDEMHDHYAKQDSHQKFKYVDTAGRSNPLWLFCGITGVYCHCQSRRAGGLKLPAGPL